MRLLAGGATDVGRKRSENEDRIFVDTDSGLFIVCDGMGGHAAGALAAQTAIDVIAREIATHAELLQDIADGQADAERAVVIVEQALVQACAEVFDLATTRPDAAGMGCTATVVLVAGWHAALGHVGDSRLYVCRLGQAHRLSSDHTMARDLVAQGLLAPEDVADHPFAGALTRAIGVQRSVQVETLLFDLRARDRLLLCSDGLHAYIDSHAWLAGELADEDMQAVAEELVAHANARGGHDNISAVVVHVTDDPQPPALPHLDIEVAAKLETLEQVHLFRGLGLARLYHVLGAAKFRTLAPGEALITPQDELSALYVIARGAVRANLVKGGSVRLGPGDHFGATTLLRPRPCRARIEATVETTIIEVDRARFQRMVRAKPYLGLLLYERLGRHIAGELDRADEALLDIRGAVRAVGPEASVTL